MDEDGARFAAWFQPWRDARPDIGPIGWYVYADLEAAFDAGRADQHQQALDEILERTRRLEAVVLRALDDRPGNPPDTPPSAGPVPTQD